MLCKLFLVLKSGNSHSGIYGSGCHRQPVREFCHHNLAKNIPGGPVVQFAVNIHGINGCFTELFIHQPKRNFLFSALLFQFLLWYNLLFFVKFYLEFVAVFLKMVENFLNDRNFIVLFIWCCSLQYYIAIVQHVVDKVILQFRNIKTIGSTWSLGSSTICSLAGCCASAFTWAFGSGSVWSVSEHPVHWKDSAPKVRIYWKLP